MTTPFLNRRDLLRASAGVAAAPALIGFQAKAAESQPLARRLAEYAFGLEYADIDPATIERVKIHLVDTFGCALAALDETVVARVRKAAAPTSRGPSSLIGSTGRTTVEMAAFVNGAAIRAWDLNDGYGAKEFAHPSDLIAACLAVAEAEGRSTKDFIVSVVLAYEIVCRLCEAAQIRSRGWDHPTYSVVAAALAAGKLMGLTADQLTEAVNMALVAHIATYQTRVQEISSWKGLADPYAGRSGVFAANLARTGLTGPGPIFEGEWGFNKLIVGAPLVLDTADFGGRGKRFRINDCTIKLYPAQGGLISGIVAAVSLSDRIKNPADIASVVIATPKVFMATAADEPEKWAPATRETADHSLPYVVARSLLDGVFTMESYAPEKLGSRDVLTLLSKVRVEEDPKFTVLFPRKSPNRVTVTLKSREVLTEEVIDLPGGPSAPLSRRDVEAKFRQTVGARKPRSRDDRLIRLIWTLEEGRGVADLLRAMA